MLVSRRRFPVRDKSIGSKVNIGVDGRRASVEKVIVIPGVVERGRGDQGIIDVKPGRFDTSTLN